MYFRLFFLKFIRHFKKLGIIINSTKKTFFILISPNYLWKLVNIFMLKNFLKFKKLLKIFSINLVFLLIFSEVGARFLLSYKKRNNFLVSSQLLQEYLNYVNHFRDNNIKEKYLEIYKHNKNNLPLNFNDESIFIYDLISNCKNKGNWFYHSERNKIIIHPICCNIIMKLLTKIFLR